MSAYLPIYGCICIIILWCPLQFTVGDDFCNWEQNMNKYVEIVAKDFSDYVNLLEDEMSGISMDAGGKGGGEGGGGNGKGKGGDSGDKGDGKDGCGGGKSDGHDKGNEGGGGQPTPGCPGSEVPPPPNTAQPPPTKGTEPGPPEKYKPPPPPPTANGMSGNGCQPHNPPEGFDPYDQSTYHLAGSSGKSELAVEPPGGPL